MNGVQTFDIRGGETLLGAAGNFIRFDSTSGKPIRVRGDGQDLGMLWPDESLTLPDDVRQWSIVADASESGTVRIGTGRIDGHVTANRAQVLLMETGLAQVAAGAGPGWVSGDVSGLAGGATVNCVFDLGPDWRQYALAEITVLPKGPSTGLNPVQVFGSDNGAAQESRRRGHALAATDSAIYLNLPTSGGPRCVNVRPVGRYLVVQATNGDAANAQGPAARITVAAYPS